MKKKMKNVTGNDCMVNDQEITFGRYIRIYEPSPEGRKIVFELYEEPAVSEPAPGEPVPAETQKEVFDYFEQLFKERKNHDL